jgi:hypothetical protein
MRFTLVVMPNGRAILASKTNLERDEYDRLQETWQVWRESSEASALFMNADVVQVKDIELEVEPK